MQFASYFPLVWEVKTVYKYLTIGCIQVAYLILDEKTREREFGNLMNIPDHYPKYVISMDEFNAGTNDKGIKQLHVRDFLKMEI